MMLQHYSTPGIYPQDVFVPPPAALRTGVPAFIGLISRSEANAAGIDVSMPNVLTPITLWPQFSARFGAVASYGYLALAVYGFFLNGGRMCYPLVACFEDGTPPAIALDIALHVLATNSDIDLICAPDIMRWPAPGDVQIMQAMLLDHCAALGDRFAILDALPSTSAADVLNQAQALNSPNSALYFPWLDVGIRTGAQHDVPIYVPPSGHMAGIYARSDEQVGVYKAPANERIEGVLDLHITLTDSQQAQLNDGHVNCLRSFPGRGIRVWGARTLSQDTAWTYVNTRRVFQTAGRWIARTLADVAFEPNDPLLWARIEREVNAYCNALFQRGALRGGTPEEAFYVRCDGTTNPLDARDRGEVVTEIGLAPSFPNEFIVVRIIHGASGVTMTGPELAR